MIRVILAGEGKNELGSFALEVAYHRPPKPGVVEALLRQIQPAGWEVVDAIPWRKTPKLQVGIGNRGEEHNVRRAFHHAKKRGCDVFAFTRDRDKAKFAHREEDIERALTALKDSDGPAIIGGIAIEKLESWLAAIAGTHGSEALRRPEEILSDHGINNKDTDAMVRFVEQTGLGNIPADARTLRRWLERARLALIAIDAGERSS